MAKKESGIIKWCYGITNLGTKELPWFGVAEVYHKKGKVVGVAPTTNIGDETPEGVVKVLKMILKDIKIKGKVKVYSSNY